MIISSALLLFLRLNVIGNNAVIVTPVINAAGKFIYKFTVFGGDGIKALIDIRFF